LIVRISILKTGGFLSGGIMKLMLKHNLKDFLIMTGSVLLLVFGIYFFKFPSNFAFGGVTGIAMILSHITNGALSSGTVVLILNILLLIIGFLFLGKQFGIKTVYCSLLMSFSLKLLENVFPMSGPLTNEPLLELIYAVAFPAIAAAILFNIDASTGGTDIVAMLLKKYTSINIGRCLLIVDFLLTAITLVVFDIKTGMLCCLGLMLKSLVIDSVIESINLCKYFTVVCEKPDLINDYIVNTLHRSATISEAKGAFTKGSKTVIFTILSRAQAAQLKKYIKEVDSNAFIVITNTSEIIGRGFRGI